LERKGRKRIPMPGLNHKGNVPNGSRGGEIGVSYPSSAEGRWSAQGKALISDSKLRKKVLGSRSKLRKGERDRRKRVRALTAESHVREKSRRVRHRKGGGDFDVRKEGQEYRQRQ